MSDIIKLCDRQVEDQTLDLDDYQKGMLAAFMRKGREGMSKFDSGRTDPRKQWEESGQLRGEWRGMKSRLEAIQQHVDLACELRYFTAEAGDEASFIDLHTALWGADVHLHSGLPIINFERSADELAVITAYYSQRYLCWRDNPQETTDIDTAARLTWSVMVNGLIPSQHWQRAAAFLDDLNYECPAPADLTLIAWDGYEATGSHAPRFA